MAGGFVEVSAFSKINLFLTVLGKREDGYHNLVSVMQTLSLCDDLIIKQCDTNIQKEPIILEANIPTLSVGDDNLIIKAAKLITNEYKINQPIKIILTKRIPIGAGLGGGSSDCAATLKGINQLFGLNISLDKLIRMGKTLGADVPFCLLGGTAIAEGVGEVLTPLPPPPKCYVVLACPPIHVSTKEIFELLEQKHFSNKSNLNHFITAYKSQDINQITQHFENTFTQITSILHPQIKALIIDLKNQGANASAMTGTGSTVFAYFDNKTTAENACKALQQLHKDTRFFITHTNPTLKHG